MGWKLVHHPLYGNYRPHQQPYRSILLQREAENSGLSHEQNPTQDQSLNPAYQCLAPDPASLQLIEAALDVYRADRVLNPQQVPDVMLRDCSQLDYELMRLPLEQAGWEAA
jgi:hypothetical protein